MELIFFNTISWFAYLNILHIAAAAGERTEKPIICRLQDACEVCR